MKYLYTIFRTGSPLKAPAAAPDPAIAEEKARRESLAISMADQRRSRTQGAAATVLTGGTRGRTNITRPTDQIVALDPSKTKAGQTLASADKIAATPGTTTPISSGRAAAAFPRKGSAAASAAAAADLRKAISPADMAAFKAAQKDKNIASFRSRTRSRLGVRSSIGVQS